MIPAFRTGKFRSGSGKTHKSLCRNILKFPAAQDHLELLLTGKTRLSRFEELPCDRISESPPHPRPPARARAHTAASSSSPPSLPSFLSTPINVTVYVIRGGGGDATTCAVPPLVRKTAVGRARRFGSLFVPRFWEKLPSWFCLLRGVGRQKGDLSALTHENTDRPTVETRP